jgi:peptide/nickel transport system permease protein
MALFKSKKSSKRNSTSITDTVQVSGLSQSEIIRTKFFRHRVAVSALVLLIFLILLVFTSSGIHLGTATTPIHLPGWWPLYITDIDPVGALANVCNGGISGCPTLDFLPEFIDGNPMQFGTHPIGSDDIGVDWWALVTRGAEQSLTVMVIVGFLGITIGTAVGAVAGFFGGIIDAVLMRVTDIFLVTPTLILGAIIGQKFGNLGVVPLAIMLGLFAWIGLARFVRTEFLTLREREFVDAARVAGASNRRIIFKHILPNAIGIIIVSGTLLLSSAILIETALSYLGFGVRAPDVSLGLLISQNQASFLLAPWLFWWPAAFIVLIALCINFIGDGLRDAFDPRQIRTIPRVKKAKRSRKSVV